MIASSLSSVDSRRIEASSSAAYPRWIISVASPRATVLPRSSVTVLAAVEGTEEVKYIHGKRGMGTIPANATLCFEVELVEIGSK